MKIRLTPCILDEVRDAVCDVMSKVDDNDVLITNDPSDHVYFKIANAQRKNGATVIDADERDVQELMSRALYNIESVIPENLEYYSSYPEDRGYWLGRMRAYKSLVAQINAAA